MRPTEAVLLFLILIFFVLVLVVVMLVLRHRNQQMLHQERLVAIEKGTPIPERTPAPWSPRVYLLRGLVWSLSGAALIAVLFGLAASSHRPVSGESLMWRANTLSQTSGIPLEQARQIVQKDEENRPEGTPSSVALLGLIPFAVGLAYLIFYMTDESRRQGSNAGNGGTLRA
jgi:hypothetical protein